MIMKQSSLHFRIVLNQNKILFLWIQEFCSLYIQSNYTQLLLNIPVPKKYLPYPRMHHFQQHLIQKHVLLENTWNIIYFQYFCREWLNFCIKQRRKSVLSQNPKRKDEPFTEFFSIPFVKDWLKDHPRPPIPLSLLLSEEEACKIIQSFWRGYRVRCDTEVQELRQWQKQLREDKNIIKRVQEFWTKQETKVGSKLDSEEPIPNRSGVSILFVSSTPQNTELMD
ncbi:IQ domain-containing protein K isoform X6 [Chelonia mydas]|uniref:IQ domain-containing protein K isoform X6 n=1 Tax=Chelonia mydas TaxID=8469 RepID=UPI0018A1E67D|nr:IQ domain-containing protein K isoform X6 [Chelonia mydas]